MKRDDGKQHFRLKLLQKRTHLDDSKVSVLFKFYVKYISYLSSE